MIKYIGEIQRLLQEQFPDTFPHIPDGIYPLKVCGGVDPA
jgi:hypothetical protein